MDAVYLIFIHKVKTPYEWMIEKIYEWMMNKTKDVMSEWWDKRYFVLVPFPFT